MESIGPRHHEPNYLCITSLSKFRDCKMAAIYQEQQNRTLYYECAPNQSMPISIRNYEQSLNGNTIRSSKVSPPSTSQQRLHAYDYHMYNEQKYSIPSEEHVYDKLRSNYSISYPQWNDDVFYENSEASYFHRPKSRCSRTDSRARAKCNKIRQRYGSSTCAFNQDNFFDVTVLPRTQNLTREQNISHGLIYEARSDILCDNYGVNHEDACSSVPTRVPYRSDSSHGRLQQWPWSSRDMYAASAALSPSSPLDSGLSSQSVASSPSLEGETIQVKPIPECGSPVSVPVLHRNQCSCSTTSFHDPNALSPVFRSDSGRSSPWTQSAVSRLNALTETKSKIDMPYLAPIYVDVVPSPYDLDQKRYSMSGIFLSPSDEANMTSTKLDMENRSDRFLKQYCKTQSNFPSCPYEFVDDVEVLPFLKTSATESIRSKKNVQYKQFQVDTGNVLGQSNQYGLIPSNHEHTEPIESEHIACVSNSHSKLAPLMDSKSASNNMNHRPKLLDLSEKALCELEEMYCKLNLQDYDLLDRAERRDLPTKHQVARLQTDVPSLTRSKSDSFFEILGPDFCTPFKNLQRAPPLRRAGVPDRLADDMATRKLNKSVSKPSGGNDNTATYMLYSSHFTPSIQVPNEVILRNRPDIEYDDLSYRRYFHMSSGKVSETQPPFGIPLKPNPPQSIFSDYLHVVPSSTPQPLCHPRGNPDLVRDDLAFRSLRKDSTDRAMYDSYSLFRRKIR